MCADNEILCVSSAKIVLKVKFHPESKGFTSFVYFIIFSVYLHLKRYKIATNNTYFTKISFAIVHYGCMGFFLSKIQTTNFFLIIIVVYKITLKFCCLKIHFLMPMDSVLEMCFVVHWVILLPFHVVCVSEMEATKRQNC